MRVMLGIEIMRAPRVKDVRALFLTQESYTSNICELFLQESNLPESTFKRMSTPMKAKDDKEDLEAAENVGRFAGETSKHAGRFYWLVRGTRPDIANPVQRLARRAQGWTAADDLALVRMYKYLHWTRRVGLWLRCDLGELQELFFSVLADADHAGDRATSAGRRAVASSAMLVVAGVTAG